VSAIVPLVACRLMSGRVSQQRSSSGDGIHPGFT
jgi:hypothetical protein